MKFTDLSQHLHELREKRSGRAIGSAMRLHEVWDGALQSDLNTIKEIRCRMMVDLPKDIMGTFVRARNIKTGSEMAVILVNQAVPAHWREFVAIKEMMHCWSPVTSHVRAPEQIFELYKGQVKSEEISVSSMVAADINAIAAAAEVMLPLKSIEPVLCGKITDEELAHRHGLHIDVVKNICSIGMIKAREIGSF